MRFRHTLVDAVRPSAWLSSRSAFCREARTVFAGVRPDWHFPQTDVPPGEVAPGWRPTYVDYLFLSFSTCTAFSTTEVSPMTRRAKMLMMLEAVISLVTITAVAARAINVLGS